MRGAGALGCEPDDETLDVAAISIVDATSIEAAIESAAEQIDALAQVGTHLVVLPELFCFEAARIVDPIFSGQLTGVNVWGQFLKDYKPAPW